MQQNSPIRPLSEQDVQSIEPVRHARKITVGRCLYLNVTPTGGRSWHYKFYFEGKCKKLMLGTYPEISLGVPSHVKETLDEGRGREIPCLRLERF
jgi:hypothetical protein